MRLVSSYIKDSDNVLALQRMLQSECGVDGKPYYAGKDDGIGGIKTTKALQSYLRDNYGYDKGIDGDIGTHTKAAMSRWAEENKDLPFAEEANRNIGQDGPSAFSKMNQMTPIPQRINHSHAPNMYADLKQSTPAPDTYGQTPIDWDLAMNSLVHQESRGNQFDKNGNTLTSSKGAMGIAQLMPSTGPEAAKLAGVDWNETLCRTSPEYNKVLGQAYLMKQYEDFGSLDKAYAAYNAGPGTLRSALKEAKSENNPDDWLSKMPRETRKYVANTMNRYNEAVDNTVAAAPQPEPQIAYNEPTRQSMCHYSFFMSNRPGM